MRILLILLFILVANTVYADIHKICEGFCEGEELEYSGGIDKKFPLDVVIKGKKKKIKFPRLYSDWYVKNSACTPFMHSSLADPKKKNKPADPTMQKVSMVGSDYMINICAPCPPDMAEQLLGNTSGYCPLPH